MSPGQESGQVHDRSDGAVSDRRNGLYGGRRGRRLGLDVVQNELKFLVVRQPLDFLVFAHDGVGKLPQFPDLNTELNI